MLIMKKNWCKLADVTTNVKEEIVNTISITFDASLK